MVVRRKKCRYNPSVQMKQQKYKQNSSRNEQRGGNSVLRISSLARVIRFVSIELAQRMFGETLGRRNFAFMESSRCE